MKADTTGICMFLLLIVQAIWSQTCSIDNLTTAVRNVRLECPR